MWGVEFLAGTKNSLLFGTAVFEVRINPYTFPAPVAKRYQLTFGPNGMFLTSAEATMSVNTEDVEAILPEDFGHTWTWEDFLLAMTFWGEGNQTRRE